MSDNDIRFGGVARLYGRAGLERLRAAHLAVVGVGGVGSWAVEALARSGVGRLTLVDLDDVCLSNVNRQLPALEGTIGRPKVAVLAERVRAINPECEVTPRPIFFAAATADEILAAGFDGVVDAIDPVADKCQLIASCHRRGVPVVVCGAAGGRCDPTAVRVADCAAVTHDRLLSEVRKRLRREHGFPRDGAAFGVDCVFSPEPPVILPPEEGSCAAPATGEGRRLHCDSGLGSAVFVTGVFGFVAAGRLIERILRHGPRR